MNIILLEEHELGRNLSRRDERTIHLLKVLHKKCGDEFEAGILGGIRATGRIEKINRDGSIFITIHGSLPPVPRLGLRMAVSFVRPIQLKRLFRDLSNIGVSAIDLIGTDMGEKSYRDTKLLSDGGSRSALIEGAVQARDTQIPELNLYDSIDNWLSKCPWEKENDNKIFSRSPLLLVMDNIRAEGSFFSLSPSNRPGVIAIGPERGWSDRERDLFEKSGFLRLSMGERALRTETACVAAAALAMEKTEIN
ncbi:MAG: RsmE family RNA methyltransferase [Treponema sp.]|nr:RsmE family RNA methyltransferase [Treponema sp.]MCL2237108.1 RsmE family RNA methyltransferase [Treponema sp.]